MPRCPECGATMPEDDEDLWREADAVIPRVHGCKRRGWPNEWDDGDLGDEEAYDGDDE